MISRESVLQLLQEKQHSAGGYTGDDIIEFAEIFGVTPRGLRRRIIIRKKCIKIFRKKEKHTI